MMKRFDIYIGDGPQAKQLRFTVEAIVHEQGGRVSGVGYTPAGTNVFGWAPEPVIAFFEKKAKEFKFIVKRNGEPLESLMEEIESDA
jgi:hypothetical protein